MSENKKENKPTTFILNDESVNRLGFRILTDGIDLSGFKKNPITLWMHYRATRGTKDEILPIGFWAKIRKEDGKLLADVVFDEDDDFAQKVKSKVEQGIIRMASISVDVIATSEDKSVLVQGQTRPTVVKCFLKEASICDIGCNRNAIRLCDEYGMEINLSDNYNHLLPILSDPSGDTPGNTNPQTDTNVELRDQIAGTLNLSEGVSNETVYAAVQGIQTENTTLKDRIAGYEKAEIEAFTVAAKKLVDDAILERRLTESDRTRFESMALADPENTKMILNKLAPVTDLSNTDAQGGKSTASGWNARLTEIDEHKTK